MSAIALRATPAHASQDAPTRHPSSRRGKAPAAGDGGGPLASLEIKVTRKSVRNALAGFLTGYGFVAFFCGVSLQQHLNALAPRLPDVAHGLIVAHAEHGGTSYFSAFQGTSCTLLLVTSIPLTLLGMLIGPKRNFVNQSSRRRLSATWDADDPGRWRPIGLVAGMVAAPIIIFGLGPPLVAWLNARGWVIGF
jgi:hypothetical protein